jgi:hypothetical protein
LPVSRSRRRRAARRAGRQADRAERRCREATGLPSGSSARRPSAKLGSAQRAARCSHRRNYQWQATSCSCLQSSCLRLAEMRCPPTTSRVGLAGVLVDSPDGDHRRCSAHARLVTTSMVTGQCGAEVSPMLRLDAFSWRMHLSTHMCSNAGVRRGIPERLRCGHRHTRSPVLRPKLSRWASARSRPPSVLPDKGSTASGGRRRVFSPSLSTLPCTRLTSHRWPAGARTTRRTILGNVGGRRAQCADCRRPGRRVGAE